MPFYKDPDLPAPALANPGSDWHYVMEDDFAPGFPQILNKGLMLNCSGCNGEDEIGEKWARMPRPEVVGDWSLMQGIHQYEIRTDMGIYFSPERMIEQGTPEGRALRYTYAIKVPDEMTYWDWLHTKNFSDRRSQYTKGPVGYLSKPFCPAHAVWAPDNLLLETIGCGHLATESYFAMDLLSLFDPPDYKIAMPSDSMLHFGFLTATLPQAVVQASVRATLLLDMY